jgi:hypothetical protein
MLRRNLIKTSALAPLALAGCVSQTTANTIAVTLANAQAEANTILTALQTLIPNLKSTIPAGIVSAVNADLTTLENDVSSFVLLTPGSSYVANAQAVIKDVSLLLPILPLPTATSFAISMGLSLISGLLAGVSSMSIPTIPASSSVSAHAVVPGPIPVPLS